VTDVKSITGLIRIAASLSKIRISLSVTATTFTGYFVHSAALSQEMIPLLTGIFLLAAGSSALNHLQERKTDAKMERTNSRPIPAGMVSPRMVFLITLASLISGGVILYLYMPVAVLILGLFNFFWYNGVYTPLKKVTAFAVIPGSVTGGVPPLIGWIAAGGQWNDTAITIIVLFFIVGQIPHFWLLLLRYGREYENAGLPSLTSVLSYSQINLISYAWIVAAVATSALLPAQGLITGPTLLMIYFTATTTLLILTAYSNLSRHGKSSYRLPFISLNIYYLLIMSLLIANSALTNKFAI
jgi:heme o synthase